MAKILVGRQHRKVVPEAKLREESIDRPGLHASTAAAIAQFGSFDMVRSIRHD